MNREEWDELNVLRKAITDNPASVDARNQERFTELLVESWGWIDSPTTDPEGTVTRPLSSRHTRLS